MIGQVQTINGQKQIVSMTGGVPDGSVGSLIMKFKKIQPKNCLYCDGRDTTGTEEELSTYYPALYMYLGSNVLPDYRECSFVGAEQNTTDAIATHDVYTQGQFKDDCLQQHQHKYADQSGTNGQYESSTWVARGIATNNYGAGWTGGANASGNRTDAVTRGKRKAVYVYIVAIDSVAVSDDESFLRVVENYIDEKNSYSTTEQLTGGTWIDGKPIYRKVIDIGALPSTSTKTITNAFSNIDTRISMYGFAESSAGGITLPYIDISGGTTYLVNLYQSGKVDFSIRTNFNAAAYTGFVIVEYTKAT